MSEQAPLPGQDDELYRRLLRSQADMINDLSRWLTLDGFVTSDEADHKAVDATDRPRPITRGDDSVSLLGASILIANRLRGGKLGGVVLDAPWIFAQAIRSGELDPRDPWNMLPLSVLLANPARSSGTGSRGQKPLVDMRWRLWPRDLNAFVLKYWREPLYSEAELAGSLGAEPPTGEARPGGGVQPTQKQDRGPGALYGIIRALAAALAETDPKRFKNGDGTIKTGCAKAATVSGIVGHLKDGGFSALSSTTLEDHIRRALRE